MTLLSNNEPVMEVMVLVIVCGQDAGIINLRKAGLLTLQVLRPEYSRITRPIALLLMPWLLHCQVINTLRPKQYGRHFADDTFNCIFLNEQVRISIEISLKFVPEGTNNNNPALVQIMAWRRPGDKPLSEPMMMMMVRSSTHTCVIWPHWVNKHGS